MTLREALERYEADPINIHDRPESWAALDALLDAVRAALAESPDEPEIAALRARHVEQRYSEHTSQCAFDRQSWPCDAAWLLSRPVEADLPDVRTALKEAVRLLSGGQAGYVGDHSTRTVQVRQDTVDRLRATLRTSRAPATPEADQKLQAENAALDAGTHQPAVDDFGNQYLAPVTPEADLRGEPDAR